MIYAYYSLIITKFQKSFCISILVSAVLQVRAQCLRTDCRSPLDQAQGGRRYQQKILKPGIEQEKVPERNQSSIMIISLNELDTILIKMAFLYT